MKKGVSKLVCVFGLFLFVFQIKLSSISKLNNLKFATTAKEKALMEMKKLSKGDPLLSPPSPLPLTSPISCDRSHLRYDLCTINGPTVLDPTTYTFFATDPPSPTQTPIIETIRPYPRKFENFIMAQIKDIKLTLGPPGPQCEVQHNAPALVFSAGGYTGNFFHDFNDGFIPLFITVNKIYPNQDFVIVVSESSDWWVSKYADILHSFSKHPIITLDNDTATHCFPYAKVGLISHGFMTINHTLIPNHKTFIHFRGLLENAYGYGQNHPLPEKIPNPDRPRLMLATRSGGGRVIINRDELVMIIKNVGFDVIEFEPVYNTSLHESYALVNSSHAMLGVHGAALTHALFLRSGAVLVQVVPIGVEWAAGVYFGRVAREINLEYMEYKIGVKESSLEEKYGKDNVLVKDPYALQSKGWPTDIMDIYLKEQNVKIDVDRFRGYLEKAYKKAKRFMDKEGSKAGSFMNNV